MVRRIAIVPARGGSKRIRNKNIRDFCGKPIIAHILEAAEQSGLFDVVHVSTDSLEIQKVVEGLGLKVDFIRPKSLADDHTPIMPVLKFVTESYASQGQQFDQVWLLMACAPLVKSFVLHEAANLFESAESKSSVLSICEYPAPIEWAFNRSSDGKLIPLHPGMNAIRSQDLGKKYFDAGVFAVFPATTVLQSEGAGSDKGFIGCVIPKEAAVDIDDEADWAFAELLYRSRSICEN